MASFYFTTLCLVTVLTLVRFAYAFYRNISAARKSGIPVVILPFNPHSIVANILAPLWRPLLALVPPALRSPWHTFLNPNLVWDELYAPFREIGSDTVLTCSPTSLFLHTCAADIISQVTDRRNDFPKPTHNYAIIDIYGKSAISVEGQLWKKHRRVTAPPFNERNNHLVWSESVYQAQKLLTHVVASETNGNDNIVGANVTIHDVEGLTSRMALAIISKAGYGVRLDWTRKDETCIESSDQAGGDARLGAAWVEGKTEGHGMSYADALFSVSNDVFWLLVLPRAVLRILPSRAARRVAQAYGEWGQYMQEMVSAARERLNVQRVATKGTDLLGSLVKSARDNHTSDVDETAESRKGGSEGFSDDEIMGNAFLLIMAGHETTAGVLHVALLLLAMHVDAQRSLQQEIDLVFLGRPPSEWDYDHDFQPAFGGMIGAVIAEVLRWHPPVSCLPKWTTAEQTLTVSGTSCNVPKNTIIALHTPAAHRNPHQWPHSPPFNPQDLEHPRSNPDDDLGDFRPERWLLSDDGASDQGNSLPKTANVAATLFRPPRGAYLPFSEGHRACLGRRFSQVELIAILSVIFQKYSVELAVDEWASNEQVEAMSQSERHEIWNKARASAKYKFRHCMRFLMTNRMTGTHVPIRFVPRGKERFSTAQL